MAEGGRARQVSSYVFAAIVHSDVKLDKQMLKCMLLHMSGKSCLQLGQLQTSYAKTSTGILCLLGSENRFRRLEHLHASKCKCMRDLHEGAGVFFSALFVKILGSFHFTASTSHHSRWLILNITCAEHLYSYTDKAIYVAVLLKHTHVRTRTRTRKCARAPTMIT